MCELSVGEGWGFVHIRYEYGNVFSVMVMTQWTL